MIKAAAVIRQNLCTRADGSEFGAALIRAEDYDGACPATPFRGEVSPQFSTAGLGDTFTNVWRAGDNLAWVSIESVEDDGTPRVGQLIRLTPPLILGGADVRDAIFKVIAVGELYHLRAAWVEPAHGAPARRRLSQWFGISTHWGVHAFPLAPTDPARVRGVFDLNCVAPLEGADEQRRLRMTANERAAWSREVTRRLTDRARRHGVSVVISNEED